MAIPVARVHLAMAHAALPALLPTPQWKMMMPLLPTPPCVVILPKSPPPKPSRADASERWDVGKNATKSPSSKPGRADAVERSNKSPSKPGRADADERWDAHKIKPASTSSSGSSQRSPDDERWDSSKKTSVTSSSSSNFTTNQASSSSERRANKMRAISRGYSSAERWDARKKPRQLQTDGLNDDGESSTGSNDMELDMPPPPPRALYAGPGFVASPEPSMLPIPSFMIRVT